jgi:hypothetical protein
MLNRLSFAVLCIAALETAKSSAETFRIPLTLSSRPAQLGEYLTADFDLGFSLGSVDTVELTFRLPGGYSSTWVTTGNSTYSRYLLAIIDEPGKELVVDEQSFHWPAPSNTTGLVTHVMDIAPNVISRTVFGPTIVWPGILTGRGRIALIDVHESSFQPLPDGAGGWSNGGWSTLMGTNSVKLTINGTPIPELATIRMLLVGIGHCALIGDHRRRFGC